MDNLSKTLNITPIERVTQNTSLAIPETNDSEEAINYDYETARTNLHKLLVQGQEALADALYVAKSSEHPRAFEVVGGLLKNIAEINHQLLDLSEKKQKLLNLARPTQQEPTQINNNAIFVGSTLELTNMIKKMTNAQ